MTFYIQKGPNGKPQHIRELRDDQQAFATIDYLAEFNLRSSTTCRKSIAEAFLYLIYETRKLQLVKMGLKKDQHGQIPREEFETRKVTIKTV